MVSYRFSDKQQFQSKIANFSHSRVFNAPTEGVLLEIGIGYRRLGQKTRMMGLTGGERSLTISLAVWIQIQYCNVTDRRTDRRTDTGRQQRPRLRISSRGKNWLVKNDMDTGQKLVAVVTAVVVAVAIATVVVAYVATVYNIIQQYKIM